MTDFVTISDPDSLTGNKKAYRVEKTSDSGHTRIRPQGRTPRNEWVLSWDGMSDDDFSSLGVFFDTYFASEFDWTHPVYSTTHTVYFVKDSFEYECLTADYWKVSFKIGEV